LKKINIYFDFDGTLFDSFEGIASAVSKAAKEVYSIDYALPIDKVGPPISIIHDIIFTNLNKKESFVKAFRYYYDGFFYLESKPYYTDIDFFTSLISLNCSLNIVSNKPTELILKLLNKFDIAKYFCNISGNSHLLTNKKERLITLVNALSKDSFNIVVGDTNEDYEMSELANCKFVFASYGYGEIDQNVERIENLDSLYNLIKNHHDKTI
jgi:phosphoglycolate phosphatase